MPPVQASLRNCDLSQVNLTGDDILAKYFSATSSRQESTISTSARRQRTTTSESCSSSTPWRMRFATSGGYRVLSAASSPSFFSVSSYASRSTLSRAFRICKRAAFCSVDCALRNGVSRSCDEVSAAVAVAVAVAVVAVTGAALARREIMGVAYIHLTIHFDLFRTFFVLGTNFLARSLHSRQLANLEVLLGLGTNFTRLVLRLLMNEGDELLNLRLHLILIHVESKRVWLCLVQMAM